MKIICVFLVVAIAVTGTKANNDKNCDVIPMEQWAGETTRRLTELTSPVDLVIVQHTVTPECYSDAECERIVKNIRNYSIKSLSWIDIGQSFLVGENGKVYEGAGWKYQGAHTLGYNNRSVSISFIGDFRVKLPEKIALQAATNLLICGQSNKYLTEDYDVVGHRQLSKTESPGSTLFEEITKWPHFLQNIEELRRQINIRGYNRK